MLKDRASSMSHHMPLVGKHLSPKGLKGWKVLEFGPDADFCVQATLEWEVRRKKERLVRNAEG